MDRTCSPNHLSALHIHWQQFPRHALLDLLPFALALVLRVRARRRRIRILSVLGIDMLNLRIFDS